MMRPPLKFGPPSLVNETKAERDFKEIVREADRYFGRKKVDWLVRDSRKRQPHKPKPRNVFLLNEWDVAQAKGLTKRRFASEFAEEHGEEVEAVQKRLNRLLDIREQQAKEKARRDAWLRRFQEAMQRFGKSLLGTGTK